MANKKSLKQFIFDKLEHQNYILDNEVYKFLNKEPNWYSVQQYKNDYFRLKSAQQYFREFEVNQNTIIKHSGNKYLIRDKMWENMKWIVIPKIYFDYLKTKYASRFTNSL
jgi:hypothetical protein